MSFTPHQGQPEPSVDELEGVATHAAQRVALYRRKVYLGTGEPRRLAELERIHTTAAGRLRRARERAQPVNDVRRAP
jgi:hypothetical protein